MVAYKKKRVLVDKDNAVFDRSTKWIEKNATEIYWTHNEGKSDVAETFVRILKYVYIDKLDDIVKKYIINEARLCKVKSYINSGKEINNKDLKFKIGDIVRVSKYKIIFAKICTPNWSEEVSMTKEVKNTPL